MDDKRKFNSLYDEPPKKEWVVQRLPIKNGGVLRSAMHVEMRFRDLPWVEVEGVVKS